MNVERWRQLDARYPKVYSFITFRREKRGGFVFNPHLYNEKWVDEVGFYVLRLSDGTHTVSDVTKSISEHFCLTLSESKILVYERLQDLGTYFAIEWIDEATQRPSRSGSQQSKERGHEDKDYYSAPLSVLWDITYRCNMRCGHCLIDDTVSSKEMSLEEAERVLRELNHMKVFNINFSGGEPLIREDFLDILRIASKLNFGLRLSTNGLLLTEALLDKLGSLDVYCIQISLDGIGETHDKFRGVEGAYERTVDVLRRASEKGFYTVMNTMITMHNIHEILGLLDLAVSIGVSSFKLNAFMPVGRGKRSEEQLGVPKAKLRALARDAVDRQRKYEGSIDVQLNPLFPWLLKPQRVSGRSAKRKGVSPKLRCSAGHTNLVISPDGTVYACPYLTRFPIGNVLETSLEDLWNSDKGILAKFRNLTQKDLKGKCLDCEYVPVECMGGCRAAATVEEGDFYGEDPFCWKSTA